MKYKVTLNGKTYEVEVEVGKVVLLDEYEACAPAPAAAPANDPGVDAFSNPKRLRSSFSAGNKNPIATNIYIVFNPANSNTEDTNIVYNNKCNGCINKLNKYSFNHLLNT